MKPFFSKFFLLILLFGAVGISLSAQTFSVSGTITDSTGINPIFGASITLKVARDSTAPLTGGSSTDSLGNFTITGIPKGFYKMKINYTGFQETSRRVMVKDSNVVLGIIPIIYNGVVLKDVEITDKQIRMTQDGDTTAFNAGAYKTNPDATAEDLVNKLPGVTNENGTIKVNGEEVKQVYVDGKPFFGDDPNAALKNMPADMIDKVQIYDKASDQSQFTGFDDGNSKKTINLITKRSAVNGKFGKFYGGYGTDDRYNAGVTLNLFNNARRITFLGMSNNINQQNFSMSDLFGMMGSSGGSGKHGGGGGGNYYRGGPAANFSVSQLGGITTTNSFGSNYSDQWGKKIKVSGSYFFNLSDNANNNSLNRNYFTTTEGALAYNETNNINTRNINNRFNFRLEYAIDSMNSMVFAAKFTSQYTDYSKELNGVNTSGNSVPLSSTFTKSSSINLGYDFSGSLTYRHRFYKEGRTISLDLSESLSPRGGTGAYYSVNKYPTDTSLIDQRSTTKTASSSLKGSLNYSEPIGKLGQLLFTYSPSLSKSSTDKLTNNFDFAALDFTLKDSALTNKYENTYITQRGGVNYKYNNTKTSIFFGSDFQYATLNGDQTFPVASKVNKSFESILPNATFNYKFSKGTNLKVIYRTSTNAPSVTQLQNVIDNSNPTQLVSGNPELSQDYQHTLIAHFGKTNADKATGFFAFVYGSLTNNYIGNSTFIAIHDTTYENIFLNAGSQLIKYENMPGYKNSRAFLTYSFAITKIKCNLGTNISAGYSSTPAKINGVLNYSNNMNFGPGLTLSSNISEKVDFTIGYNGSFNIVTNTTQSQSDNNYFSHTGSLKFNWMFYKGFVFNTTLDQTFYSGLGKDYNTNYLLWNSSLGYKFLKDKSLEAKFSVFDMLDQNKSVTRTVSDTYVEDSRTNTLQRYFMFTVTYNLKKFKKLEPGSHESENPNPEHEHGGPPPR
ncbi:outer membrane beta-barrel protein [soil metagenome]